MLCFKMVTGWSEHQIPEIVLQLLYPPSTCDLTTTTCYTTLTPPPHFLIIFHSLDANVIQTQLALPLFRLYDHFSEEWNNPFYYYFSSHFLMSYHHLGIRSYVYWKTCVDWYHMVICGDEMRAVFECCCSIWRTQQRGEVTVWINKKMCLLWFDKQAHNSSMRLVLVITNLSLVPSLQSSCNFVTSHFGLGLVLVTNLFCLTATLCVSPNFLLTISNW